ncbi:hypothetical protein Zmor_009355 [Zophobas morio]|uniref:Methyltransferase domain-containing protein n=1 Tax=Zophobas morio TaxID=2755281 RepID=A0AA38MIM6_9CUCU|nr:hypothetical protein Zmor_009355 [Zophobas morio]
MNQDPALYSKICQMQKFDATHFLNTYLNQLNLKDGASVLDVGAGDGTITLEVIIPVLPNFAKLVLYDKSEKMVNFAKRRFNDQRIEVVRMDISDDDDEVFKKRFDHVFSFYCLNFVPEERCPQAMRNIFTLLKPGGNLFATVIVDSALFEICDNMTKKQKWPPAMVHFKINPYRGVDKPEAKLRFFLEQAGFDVQVCKYEERTYTFDGFRHFLDFALAIVPVLNVASQNKQLEFVEDFTKETRNADKLSIKGSGGGEKVVMSYSVLVVCASRA